MVAITPDAWIGKIGESEYHHWSSLVEWGQVAALGRTLEDLEDEHAFLADGALVGAFLSSFVSQIDSMLSLVVRDELVKLQRPLDFDSHAEMWQALAAMESRELDLGEIPSRVWLLRVIFESAARAFVDRLSREREAASWVSRDLVSISHLKILGDVHTRGAVVCVYAKGEPRLVYKPRSLGADLLLEKIIDMVGGNACPRVPRTLDRGDYGWQEYVSFENIATKGAKSEYYEKFGGLVALAGSLGMFDLHYENIKCSDGAPYIVDSECIFGVNPALSSPASEGYFQRGVPSILGTLLVPNWTKRFEDSDPYDPSALGAFADPARHAPVRRVYRDESGGVRSVYTRLSTAPIYGSQPYGGSTKPPFAEHVADLERGFSLVGGRLSRSSVRVAIEDLVHSSVGLRTRILTRSTASFAALLQMRSLADASVTISRDATVTEWMLREERRQLDSGCIPLFELEINNSRVHSGTGDVFDLDRDAYAIWVERLRAVTDRAALAGQLHLLGASMSLGLEDADWAPAPLTRRGASASRRRSPSRAIDLIARELRDSAQRVGDHVWWTSSIQHSPGRHEIFVTRSGLYEGLAGVVFASAAAALDNRVALEVFRRSSDSLFLAVERFLESAEQGKVIAAVQGWGDGPLGAMMALAEGATLHGDVGSLGRLRQACDRLENLVPTFHSTDQLNGLSGVLVAAERLSARLGGTLLEGLRERCQEQLIEQLQSEWDESGPHVGLAHGLSGNAVGLATFANDPEAVSAIDDCFALEDLLLARLDRRVDEQARDKEMSGSWCWGAAGQLEARLVVGHDGSSEKVRERLASADFGGSTLCHGEIGRALIQQSRAYVERWGREDAERTSHAVLARLDQDPLGRQADPKYARRVGLFTGISGSLLYLSALRDSADVRLAGLEYAQ